MVPTFSAVTSRQRLAAGAGNEEIEMVAVLTLLAVALIFAAEVGWLVRA
jgi:hypothetical protein